MEVKEVNKKGYSKRKFVIGYGVKVVKVIIYIYRDEFRYKRRLM